MQPPSNDTQLVPASAGRRSFLKAASATLLGAAALLIAPLAGLRVWLQPLRRPGDRTEGSWVDVARLSALPDGEVPRRFPVEADRMNAWSRIPRQAVGAVFLRRTSGAAQVQAFNVICPHAGCLVGYTPGEEGFLCPCHNSRFALDGRVESPASPSPRGLDTLETQVRNGDEVWVRFRSFRVGIKEKLPV